MNIAAVNTDDGHLTVERRIEACRIIGLEACETFSIYRDGLLRERLGGTKAKALSRVVALSNRHPEHEWYVA